jgi:hypothetical protein
MLKRIVRDVGDMATVASEPAMEGRLLQMVLAPSPKALVIKRSKDEQRRVKDEEIKKGKKKAESESSSKSTGEQM